MRTLLSAPPTSRVGRYPKHTFLAHEVPMVAQPFMLAPVLPGETLENLFFEARTVTDPIKNSIIGWKKEFYFFYCRITDLLQDTIRDMFVDPANADIAATLGIAANSLQYNTAKGGVDYMSRCYKRVMETWFRDQDEPLAAASSYGAYGAAGIDQRYKVKNKDVFWLDSLTDKDLMPLGTDPATAASQQNEESLMLAFEQLRALGIANMTYEDWLRTNGVVIPIKDENKPEMLARFTDFQYPSNTVDPSNGTPRSAVSWVFKNGSRDPKHFKEPGFIIGISVTRPKLYIGGVAGNLSAHLTRAWDWLPNYLWDMPEQAMTSLKKFNAGTGPLGDQLTQDDAYWIDMRDLFIHGDQYQNVYQAAAGADPASHMDANMYIGIRPTFPEGRWYPSDLEVDSLFVAPANNKVKSDGYVSLSIKGHQVDYTQTHIADA